jgi:hypothetical protein
MIVSPYLQLIAGGHVGDACREERHYYDEEE